MCNSEKPMHNMTFIRHHYFSFISIIMRSSVDSKGFGNNLSIIPAIQEVREQSAAQPLTVIPPSTGIFVHKVLSVFELP